jgi:RNA polymerase sigma-70 factor, ECF subfamily
MALPGDHADLVKFRDYLMILARSRVPFDLRGRIDPSDLVHDTLCAALQQPDWPELFWLRRKLHDKLVDCFRRLKFQPPNVSFHDLMDQTSNGMSVLVAKQSSPASKVIRDEDALILAEKLKQLPEDQREAVVLKYCDGKSVFEIGRHIDKTPGAVGGLLKRGMRHLRELMPRTD